MNSKEENLNRRFRIGDIYLMKFSGCGSEQCGWRPGLVFQNNTGNSHSPNIIALPLTSSIKRTGMPTHVVIPSDGTGLARDSMVLCENPERMSKERIGIYITTLSKEIMSKVAVGNILASSAISFVDPKDLADIWKRASCLNNESSNPNGFAER